MPDVPTPVTIPLAEPTLAIAALLLLHTPGVVASDSVIVAPWLTLLGPVIAATVGRLFTVTVAVVIQPFVAVNVIMAVPAATPYTLPDGLTVAVPTALLLHEILVVRSDKNVTEPPSHTERLPSIGVGNGFTVTA